MAKKPAYIKFEMEFPIHASKGSLYSYLSTASGLSMWFANSVKLRGKEYVFTWDKNEQIAEVVTHKEGLFIKFRWKHEPKSTFFEFRIQIDELTGDVALLITDFAEDEAAMENAKLLWESQIEDLHHALGA